MDILSTSLVMSSLKNSLLQLEAQSNLTIVLAAVWIATKVYPLTSRGPTVIGQYAATREAHMEHNDMIEAILLQVTITPTTRALLEMDNIYEGSHKKLHDFHWNLNNEDQFYRLNANKRKAIWFVDSFRSFERLEDDLRNDRNHFHRSGYFSIVYTGRESDPLRTLRAIFTRLFKIYVVNINILYSSEQTVYVYTYYPFTKNTCHNTEPYFHGIFGLQTNFKYSGSKFFPEKLRNMWGCKVKVTTWTELPFIKIDYVKKTGDVIMLEGIEGMLLKLIAKRMNFTIQIVEEPLKKSGNGVDAGSIKMLNDGVTNISIVALLFDKTRQRFADPTYTYLHVPLNIAIPMGKMMTPLERLTRPFKYIIWSCLTSSVLLGIFIIFALKAFCSKKVQEFVFGRGNRKPFTYLWSAFYGISITGAVPRRNFARYFLGVWILYTFVLRSAYLAQLFLILQDSRARSELNTVSETLQQNFTFYTYPIAVPILLGTTTQPIKLELLSSDQRMLLNLFRLLADDEHANIAISIPGHFIREYNQNPKHRYHQVNILREPIINAPMTMYLRKHSYLRNRIDSIILNVLAGGLICKFEDLSLTGRAYMGKVVETHIAIPLFLLIGLFYVYAFLLLMSTLVFFLELWSKHSPLTRKVLDFFNF